MCIQYFGHNLCGEWPLSEALYLYSLYRFVMDEKEAQEELTHLREKDFGNQ